MSAQRAFDVIVIGAGVNGLVSASILAGAGRRVLVLERSARPGGLCVTEEFHPGYRANTCIDDAGWMPAALSRDLGLAAPSYSSEAGRIGHVIPREDGPPVVLSAATDETAAGLGHLSRADAAAWPGFAAAVARLSGMLAGIYTRNAPTTADKSPRDLLSLLGLGRQMRGLGRRGMIDFIRAIPMPVADFLDEWFESPLLKAALSVGGVMNVRHGPMSGGTTLVFLHNNVGLPAGPVNGVRVSNGGGGGVGALPTALVALATARGVIIRTEAPVTRIVIEQQKALGVELASGEVITARLVVSGADVRTTFASLVDPGEFDPEFLHATDHVRMRGPATRMHFALDRLPAFRSGDRWPDELLRGSLIFASNVDAVERAYDDAKHGRVSADPVLRVVIPTTSDPSMAPAGHHVASVQVQYGPSNAEAWTDDVRRRLRDTVVGRLSQSAADFAECIVAEEMLTPPDLERRFGVAEGSLLHGELALDQFLFMRPVPECARYDTPVGGLWLCGSSTHPGAGTAGVSGWLAAREILRRTR
ncbi:MAG: phytoene desaturase family protein [Gemmatimonadota bacterium]